MGQSTRLPDQPIKLTNKLIPFILKGVLLAGAMAPSLNAASFVEGCIIRLIGEEVGLNVGARHGVTVNMEFAVLREGVEIGRVRVMEVGRETSRGRLIFRREGRTIRLGDRVRSLTEPQPAPAPPPVVPAQPLPPPRPEPTGPPLVQPLRGVPLRRQWRPLREGEIVSGEDPAYDLLRELAAAGLMPGYTARDFLGESEQLYTRREMGEIVSGAFYSFRADPRRWSALHREALRVLLRRFPREVYLLGVEPGRATALLAMPSIERRVWPAGFTYTGFAESRFQMGNGGLRSDLRLRLSGYARLREGADFFLNLSTERDDAAVRWRDRPFVNQAFFQFLLPGPSGQIILGREHQRWGPGYGGTMLLADNTPAFDLVRYEREFPLFRHVCYATQFVTTLRDQGKRVYITARRIALSLSPQLELSFTEALRMQDARQFFPSLFIVPLHLVQILFEEEEQSNLVASAELTYHFDPDRTAYFQWLLDDLKTTEPSPGVQIPRKIGYLLGFHWRDFLPRRRGNLRVEFAFTDPGVYGHRQPPAAWQRDGQVLGHRMGPDSTDFYLRVRQEVTPQSDLTLVFETAWHGRKKQAVTERETLWGLTYSRDLTPNLSLSVRYLRHTRKNANYTAGAHWRDERVNLEARWGF